MISHDALRMRLRRLCEVKPKTKKCHVDQKTHEMWKGGGESREWLEIALTETLDKMGACQKNQHKKLRVTWLPFNITSTAYMGKQSSFPYTCSPSHVH